MAYEIPVLQITREAAEDLSSHQHKFVILTDASLIELCDAATEIPTGVLQNDPKAGESAQVMIIGISKVSSDAALNERDLIGTSADGQADAKVPGTDTTEYVVGQVILPSGAAGELATAAINCANPHRAA